MRPQRRIRQAQYADAAICAQIFADDNIAMVDTIAGGMASLHRGKNARGLRRIEGGLS